MILRQPPPERQQAYLHAWASKISLSGQRSSTPSKKRRKSSLALSGGIIGNRFTVFSATYIGDLVLATLTFDTLCEESGQPLTVVTAPAPAPLLAADSRVRAVHLVRSSNAILWRLEILREFAKTKRANDHIVNFEVYPPRWRFLRWLCRLDARESRAIDLPALQADERSALQRAPVSLPHRSSYYARAVGLSAEAPPEPRVVLPPAAFAHAVERTKSLTNGRAVKIVVAHPGSSSETRRAPVSLFATMLARVAAEYQVAIIVIGGASEINISTSLLETLPSSSSAVNWTGMLSLVETTALLGGADLFIGNDSGPLKLAEAMGAPTVSFWGPSSPTFAGPRGGRHRFIHFDEPATEAASAALSLLGQESPRSR